MSITYIIYSCRTEGSDFLNKALNAKYLQIRKRSNRINITITFLSWALEFLSGIFVIIARVMKFKLHWMYLIDVCLVFVIIPCTYVLNREVTKQIIIFGNWYQGVKSIFVSNASKSNQILPLVGDQIQEQQDVSERPLKKRDPNQTTSNIRIHRDPIIKNESSCSTSPSTSRPKSPPLHPAMLVSISQLQGNFKKRCQAQPEVKQT